MRKARTSEGCGYGLGGAIWESEEGSRFYERGRCGLGGAMWESEGGTHF